MTDIRASLMRGAARLTAAGIPNSRAEARLLLAHATGFPLETLIGYPERQIDGEPAYLQLVERRAAHEPLSHITGRREFWSLDFAVTRDTLDPRADSETLIEAVMERVADREAPLRIADLGTGTGCLLGALLSLLPGAHGIAVDRNPVTAAVAARNLATLGFDDRFAVLAGNWGNSLAGGFDIVVSNPPYIPSSHIDSLEPEVAVWEPRLALDGGPDGLCAYRQIFTELPMLLKSGGFAVLEFGAGQGDAVARQAAEAGMAVSGRRADLGGRVRCLVCEAPANDVLG
ncbi:MAG: peptide chain release factor N(5)-glutamine methyltransferase [Proteobacteria bacterium]|nr:peptide chain release factor N(5)-glutamine methyltransferase [Pseudomonadota bacterium]